MERKRAARSSFNRSFFFFFNFLSKDLGGGEIAPLPGTSSAQRGVRSAAPCRGRGRWHQAGGRAPAPPPARAANCCRSPAGPRAEGRRSNASPPCFVGPGDVGPALAVGCPRAWCSPCPKGLGWRCEAELVAAPRGNVRGEAAPGARCWHRNATHRSVIYRCHGVQPARATPSPGARAPSALPASPVASSVL